MYLVHPSHAPGGCGVARVIFLRCEFIDVRILDWLGLEYTCA